MKKFFSRSESKPPQTSESPQQCLSVCQKIESSSNYRNVEFDPKYLEIKSDEQYQDYQKDMSQDEFNRLKRLDKQNTELNEQLLVEKKKNITPLAWIIQPYTSKTLAESGSQTKIKTQTQTYKVYQIKIALYGPYPSEDNSYRDSVEVYYIDDFIVMLVRESDDYWSLHPRNKLEEYAQKGEVPGGLKYPDIQHCLDSLLKTQQDANPVITPHM